VCEVLGDNVSFGEMRGYATRDQVRDSLGRRCRYVEVKYSLGARCGVMPPAALDGVDLNILE
jgi:hypothetical protein